MIDDRQRTRSPLIPSYGENDFTFQQLVTAITISAFLPTTGAIMVSRSLWVRPTTSPSRNITSSPLLARTPSAILHPLPLFIFRDTTVMVSANCLSARSVLSVDPSLTTIISWAFPHVRTISTIDEMVRSSL